MIGGQWSIVVLLYQVAVIAAMIHVVMDNRQPAKTIAWALVIWFVPVAGIVLYIFFGVNTRREKLVSQNSLDQLSKRSMLEFVEQRNLRLPDSYRPLIDLFVNQNFSLPFKDSYLQTLTDGYQFFPSLLSDISRATSHIHIDIYIFEDDALGRLVSDALIAKSRQGVEVRVIYDDVGCWRVPHDFFERMREEGIEVIPFLPVRFPSFTSKVNYRNHRKLIVIDGLTGYVGGMNIAMRYVSRLWRDTMIRITGSGVYALQRAFLIDWYFVDRTLLSDRKYYPSFDSLPATPPSLLPALSSEPCLTQLVTSSPVTEYPEIMQGYLSIIFTARKYLYIETPYFLPTDPVLLALKTAAATGVDIRIIVPRRSDARFAEWASRSYLREAVAAGVHVYQYNAGFLHSKLMVSDDAIVTCGSTNVDFRSFENNFEANLFVYNRQAAISLRQVFLADQQQSLPVVHDSELLRPPFLKRLWEQMVRLLAPLM